MNPLSAISRLLGALSRLWAGIASFRWGVERTKRKASERDAQRANQIEKDVTDAKRDSARDNRPLDERLRELDGLRPDDTD